MNRKNISVLIAHADESVRSRLNSQVKSLGYSILESVSSCGEAESYCRDATPDLIISGVEFPDGDGIDTLIKIAESKTIPSIVVAKRPDVEKVERAMDDHVMAYLVEPVTEVDLKPAILVVLRRFKQFLELHEEVKDLKEALSTRKKLERAKGILMERSGMTEEDAYLHLRDLATSNRIKLSHVADMVIDGQTKIA